MLSVLAIQQTQSIELNRVEEKNNLQTLQLLTNVIVGVILGRDHSENSR